MYLTMVPTELQPWTCHMFIKMQVLVLTFTQTKVLRSPYLSFSFAVCVLSVVLSALLWAPVKCFKAEDEVYSLTWTVIFCGEALERAFYMMSLAKWVTPYKLSRGTNVSWEETENSKSLSQLFTDGRKDTCNTPPNLDRLWLQSHLMHSTYIHCTVIKYSSKVLLLYYTYWLALVTFRRIWCIFKEM